MKNLLKLIITFFIVFSIMAPLIAADFDFTIPIRLSNVPNKITHVSLDILVLDRSGGIIATHSTRKSPVSRSSLNRTIRALFSADSGKNSANAKRYSINLYLYFNNSNSKVLFKRSRMLSKGCPLDETKPFKWAPIAGNM